MFSKIFMVFGLISLFFYAESFGSDSLRLHDGSLLKGKITAEDDEKVHLNTSFAGEIVILTKNISEIIRATSREEVIEAEIEAATEVAEVAEAKGEKEDKEAVVAAAEKPPTPEVPQPQPRPRPQPAARAVRWVREISASLQFRKNHNDRLFGGLEFFARKREERMNQSYRFRSEYISLNNSVISDKKDFTGDIEMRLNDDFSWYGRSATEYRTQNHKYFRQDVAAGFSLNIFDSEKTKVNGRLGSIIRMEKDNGEDLTTSPGLDLALRINYELANNVKHESTFNMNQDFGSGKNRFEHNSRIDIVLGSNNRWRLRLEAQNTFRDTRRIDIPNWEHQYRSRLVMSF